MSLFLHITRRKFWATKENGGDITREEWQTYIQSDLELRHPGKAGAG